MIGSRPLSKEEEILLAAAGAILDETAQAKNRISAEQALEDLLAKSLSAQEAAKCLGISVVTLYIWLRESKVFGFKSKGQWRIPGFQLIEAGDHRVLLPGLDLVLSGFTPQSDPLLVSGFFTSPNCDLELIEYECEPMTPVDWMKSGRDLDKVLKLVDEIYDRDSCFAGTDS